MASDVKSVILDVQVDGNQAVKGIANLTKNVETLRAKQGDLKKENKELEKSQKELIEKNTELAEKMTGLAESGQVTEEEYRALEAQFEANSKAMTENMATIEQNRVSIAAMGEEAKVLNKEIASMSKAVQDSVKESQNAEGSYNALSAQLSQLKAAYHAAASDEEREKILKDLTKVDKRLKELDEQQGVYVRNVGNYKGAIMDAFGSMPGPIGGAIKSTQGLTGAMKAMSATPVLMVITLIVGVISKLEEKIKGNGAAMDAMTASFGAFNAIGVIIDTMIDGLVKGFGYLADAIQWVMDKIGDYGETLRESQRLAKEGLAIQQQERDMAKEVAENEQKIAELRAKSNDKLNHTNEERLQYLEEVNRLEEENAQKAYDLAKRQYDLIVAQNAQSESSQEDLKKENDAYIKMIQTQTALSNKKRELTGQVNEAKKAMEAEAKAAKKAAEDEAKAMAKAAEESAKKTVEIRKMAEDLALSLITDETQKAIAQRKLQGDREIEALNERLEKEKDLTAQQKDALSQLIRDKQAALDAELIKMAKDAEEKKAKEEQDKAKESAAKTAQLKVDAAKDGSEEEYQAKRALLDLQMQQEIEAANLTEEQKLLIKQKYQEQMEALDKAWAESLKQNTQEAMKTATDTVSSAIGYAQQAANIVSTVFSAIAENENAEMDQYRENNENKKEILQSRLDSGLISQEQYESQVNALNEEQAKKEKELQLQQAKRQKAMAIMNATLAAAQAIIQSLALSPVAYGPIPNPAGIASLALATAMGVAQVAAAAATPLPKASRGALLRGKSHAQGGIPIEAEGGEAIINKKATSRYLPILSAINQSTGGVPLYGKGGTVGDVIADTQVATQSAIDYDRVAQACGNIHPYVAVTDINEGQERMARVVERKTY